MLHHKLRSSIIPYNDPYFENTTLLLSANGTNGAQNNTFLSAGYPDDYYVAFDGAGDYLSIANNNAFNMGTSDFTIEGWFYLTSTPTAASPFGGVIIDKDGLNAVSWSQYAVSVTPALKLVFQASAVPKGGSTPTTTITGASTLSLLTWYHFAVTRVGSNATLWLNGSSDGTASNVPTNLTSATRPLLIGWTDRAGVDNTYNFPGRLSNIRVTKGSALYTSTFSPQGRLTSSTNTSLLTCQSSTIVDNSINNFSITVIGNTAATSNTPTITRNGNTTQGTFSPYGTLWSNYFDGSGDYLQIANNAAFDLGTGDVTIEAWVYVSSYPNVLTIFSTFPTSGTITGYTFAIDRSGFIAIDSFVSGTEQTIIATNNAVQVNTWTHIAYTRNSGTNRLFVNGLACTFSGSLTQALNSGGNVGKVGYQGYTGFLYPFIGYISNVRIVKGTAVYTSDFTPSAVPLTAITNTSLLTCQSNRFRDASANNFAITRNGDVSVQRFSPFEPAGAYEAAAFGGSGYFDGTGDYLSIADNANLRFGTSPFTIEAWVYRTSAGTNDGIVAKGDAGASTGWNFLILSTNVLRFANGATSLDTTTTIPAGTWCHVAAVREGTGTNQFKMYINGVLSRTATVSTNFTQTNPLYIGENRNLNAPMFGFISDLRVTNGTAVYTTNFTPPTTTLIAIANTQLLTKFTNAGILDNTMMNDLETVGNAQISTTQSKWGGSSIGFDGTGDYLIIPNNPTLFIGTSNFTIEFWLYLNAQGTYNIYDQRSTEPQVAIAIYTSSGSIRFFVNGADRITGATLSASTWYHVALCRSGTSTRLFIDGVQSGSTYTDSNNYVANPVGIGSYLPSPIAPLNGYVDDLRVTLGVARYTSTFTPPLLPFPTR